MVKKCLEGWTLGTLGYNTKFSANDIEEISNILKSFNSTKPTEIHRAIRGLDCIKFWKALEFRTFLHYTGIVILKKYLPNEAYDNFLYLFCAITIFSSREYLKNVNFFKAATNLLEDFVEQFINLYGIDKVSSNIHNLIHVSDDVYRFGPLPSISTYKFENALGNIKMLLRHGNRPLAQTAKRLIEIERAELATIDNTKKEEFPKLLNKVIGFTFETIEFDSFILKNTAHDQWFLTKNQEVVSMINAVQEQNVIHIYGAKIASLESFFVTPFDSKHLNIFCAIKKTQKPELFKISDIKCKLFCLHHLGRLVFIPLLHTLDSMNK